MLDREHAPAEVAYFFWAGLSFACVSADPATLFCAGVDFGLESTLLALDATAGLVFSFFATDSPCVVNFFLAPLAQWQWYPPVW